MRYIGFIVTFLLVVSCMKMEPEPTPDVQEGQPALVRLTIGADALIKGAGLTAGEEKMVTSAQILIFNSAGKLVTSQYFPSVDPVNGIQSVVTSSGSNMKVYVVANLSAENSNFTAPFANVQTLADLNAVKVYNIGGDVEINRRLMMWGAATGITIPPAPASVTVPVTLAYVACKMRVHMVDDTPDGESVRWADWQMQNLSRFSYLLPQSSDAVNPAGTSDYVALTSPFAWRDTTFVVNGISKPGQYTVFYLYENRRGGRVANANTPPAGYTPGAIGTTDPKDKAWYAPAKATALVANGYYATSTAYTGLKATVYLGSNSYNDYNVERGKEYVFTVTTKGIAQIDVDSRIDGTNSAFQAEILNPTLDCHYDWRPLRLESSAATLSIQILDGATGLPPVSPSTFWLKVSALNLNQFTNSSGSYVRPMYNPATDMVTSLSGITFTDASQVTFKYYYLYADEYLAEGGTRTAQVRISSSLAGSVPLVITIIQKGHQTMGTVGLRKYDLLGAILSANDYKLVVENREEATMELTSGANTGTERTSTMQWGFKERDMQSVSVSSILDYYKRNGYENTQGLVLSDINTGTLRPPYGRTGSNVISEQVHNPIFNTYAARYCFEKNRDVNGDGKIAGSEIKWYLPSMDELILIYAGEPALSQVTGEKISANPYYCSTETSDNNLSYGVRFDIGRSGTADKTSPLYVRCVRKL